MKLVVLDFDKWLVLRPKIFDNFQKESPKFLRVKMEETQRSRR